MSITAAMVVYNEEKRIEAALKSVASWCDEIIVMDRNSTDRTREIAGKYTDKIIIVQNRDFQPADNEVWLSQVTKEWVIGMTASDLIHPGLAAQIAELIKTPDFPYDIIQIPFRRYVLGLETPRSPWYSELSPGSVFRKSVARVNKDLVHAALWFDTERIYKMRNSEEFCMYHLTHSTADMMMDRHAIYFRAEAKYFPKDQSLWKAFSGIFRGFYILIFKRRTFLMGWDGAALSMAYLSYWMLRFVYIWEARSGKATEAYAKIRSEIEKAWAGSGDVKKN